MRRDLGMVLVAGLGLVWAAAECRAQSKPSDNPAPCTVAPQPDPCGTTPAPSNKPGTKEKFPFPGEASGSPSSAPDAPAPSLSGVPQAPGAGGVMAPSAAKKFPFPGEAAGSDASPTPGSSSSSSSSSAGDDSAPVDPNAGATPALADKGSEGSPAAPGRHILHRVNPVGTKLQSTDEREQEDLDVAHFYVESGDLSGAYLRSQDAVKVAPDDPDAHFALAEIALKLNKRDVAIVEYNACLKLDPTDKQAKAARKELARLKP